MGPLLLSAFLAGLAGTPHCAGMCGPVAAAQSGEHAMAWQLGKLVTYAGLGAAAATAASILPRVVSWGPALGLVAWLVLLWFSLRLAGVRLPRVPIEGTGLLHLVARVPRGWGPVTAFGHGLLMGLLPCGLVYAAIALSLAAPDPGTGALAMVSFGLGTVPAVTAARWGLRRASWRSKWARWAVALVVFSVGSASLAHRGMLGHATLEDPNVCHSPK